MSLLSTAAMLVISFVCCDRFDFGTTKIAGLWMKYIGTVRAKLLISTVGGLLQNQNHKLGEKLIFIGNGCKFWSEHKIDYLSPTSMKELKPNSNYVVNTC